MDVPVWLESFKPIYWAIPVFTILIFAEMIYGKISGRARFEPHDSAASLVMGLGNTVASVVFGGLTTAWFFVVYEFHVFDIGFAWWVWPVALVLDDFVYYWSHRFAHTVRWFWADHVVHHSSQHYNLTTALRQPWFSVLTLKWMWLGSILILIGFHPLVIASVGALNLIYQFWIHTEAVGKCPSWFEAVMNTPSHHRVHHATNPIYLDRNYAGIFIVWDKMFGTFQPELEHEACRYGVVKNLGTYNPLVISVHEWLGIIQDINRAPTLKAKLLYLLAPPGWSHDGSRDTSRQILSRWQEKQAVKDPQTDPGQSPAE